MVHFFVTKCTDFLICGIIATRASHVCIPTLLGTGGCLSLVRYLVMTNRPDFLIGGIIATRTSHVCIPTLLGTSSFLSVMVHFFVTKRSDQFFTAHGTGLRVFAVSSLPCLMPRRRDNLLRNKNLVTYGTMLTFGLTGIGTIGSNSCIDHLGVTQCSNRFRCFKNHATDRALGARSRARLGTGRILCRNSRFGMSCSGNLLLLNQNRITYRAMLTFCQAGCGTGCTNYRIDDLVVTCRVGLTIYVRIAATGAGVRGIAACGTGRRGDNRLVAMTGCSFFNIGGIVACRAVLVCIPTIVSTSGGLCRNLNQCVAQGSNVFGVGIVTIVTSKGSDALVRTSGFRGNLSGITMLLCRDSFRLFRHSSAVRALFSCC